MTKVFDVGCWMLGVWCGCVISAEFECEVRKNQSGERKSGRLKILKK
jgi:hypothetical protein